jgi:hypothetical protein
VANVYGELPENQNGRARTPRIRSWCACAKPFIVDAHEAIPPGVGIEGALMDIVLVKLQCDWIAVDDRSVATGHRDSSMLNFTKSQFV